MRLIVTEKNDAAEKIAALLASGKPQKDKVYNTPVYRFDCDGEECVTIGLRGHILELEFVPELTYSKRDGWYGVNSDGEMLEARLPDAIDKPPFKKRYGFTEHAVQLDKWRLEALPYLVYGPIEKLPKEKDIIRTLKNLAKKADSVVIATDFDREGELIGADALSCVRQVNPTAPVTRARYSAFTKEEIRSAFDNLTEVDMDLASAGQSRREIDLIWGAVLTRFLSAVKRSPTGTPRSAGRVQTPTLAIVVQRERERNAFVPEDYWVVKGSFDSGDDAFEAPHATARFKTAEAAQAAMDAVAGCDSARISSIEQKRRTQQAPAPFNTASLMAAASSEGITPSRTMRIAESLYMRGLISYPRVDNTVYPKSLDLRDVVTKISANPAYAPYCAKLLSRKTLKATRGKQETTDHPPIYPTAAATPDTLAPADWKLYNLIARRFLATLSEAAVIEGTKMQLDVNGEPFVAKGDVYVKAGFREIYPFGMRKDVQLPLHGEGESIAFNGATCEQKQTEPPARFTQGKLVAEMEKLGLGTKATRTNAIDRLYEVNYIVNDPIEPTQMGMAVIDALGTFAPEITQPDMTANLETQMSGIAAGVTTLGAVVQDSRERLDKQLAVLMPQKENVKDALAGADAADSYVGTCPKCGGDLQLKTARKSRSTFVGCSNWPECDVTYSVPAGKLELLGETCETCGSPRIKVTPFRMKAQTVCINHECPTNQRPKVFLGMCPVCGEQGIDSKLHAIYNPRTLKRSVRCENYDVCKTSYPLPQRGDLHATEDACESCGAPIVEVDGKRGAWRLCVNIECPAKSEEGSEAPKEPAKAGRSKAAAGGKTPKTEKAAKA